MPQPGTACRDGQEPPGPVAAVRAILSAAELDYARAKLALDGIVDPSTSMGATLAELDRMAATAAQLAGPHPSEAGKLSALRKSIYDGGPWNGYRPFSYDHANLRGANVRVKLLSHYLGTRLGDCVSMPVLLLILADKLGLNVALSQAPNHLFVRCMDTSGSVINLEATSGANPARDEWIGQVRPMRRRAVETGLYLRTLSRHEGIAAMATTVLQHLMDRRRYEEAIAVSEIILQHHPRDGLTLANQGIAYFHLAKDEFLDRHPAPFLIPAHRQPRYHFLRERNLMALAAAEALGWEPPPEKTQRLFNLRKQTPLESGGSLPCF